MIMKKLKKHYKWIITCFIIISISVLIILICKNLFDNSESNRLDNIENHEISKKEINLVEENLNKLEFVENIDILTNYKIVKIFIKLKEEVDFNKVNEIVVESINNFSEKNLGFYDVEIFVDCINEESEIYPKIGYKHKSNSEFAWNR